MDDKMAWPSTDSITCCRICVVQTEEYYPMTEPLEGYGSKSLQIVLEKLFPSVFNETQLEYDYSMNWPTAVCRKCKQRVQDAYELYETCLDSGDKLQKKGFTENKIDEEVPVLTPIDVSTEEFVECDLVEEIALGPMEIYTISQSTEVKTRKSEMKEAESVTKSSTKRKKIPKETIELKIEEMDDENEAEIIEDQNTESDWEPPVSRIKKAHSNKANAAKKSQERKKREKKELTKKQDKKAAEHLESRTEVYRCQLCEGTMYESPKELTEHLKAEHPTQIRSCDKCPKIFVNEQSFQHHQYCHATGRSFFCTFCDKGFQTEVLLECHIRSHSRKHKFLCSICGKGCSNTSNLKKHMSFHTDSKSWPCSLCPCRFNTKACLNVHMRTHTKTKLYTCPTCGSQFNKHYSMVKHQIIHTGERPFVCDLCPMRFVSPYHVKRHMLTHTGEKPYKCTYCDRGFAQSNVLVKHMKTHIGDHPYQCDRCDASFRLLKDLRNHFQEHYVESENGIGPSPVVDDQDIRFTSVQILKLRYQKEMNQSGQKDEESDVWCQQNSNANISVKKKRKCVVYFAFSPDCAYYFKSTMEEEYLTIDIKSTFCRVCATVCSEQHCIYETVYQNATLSMHMMMEKIVPSVFNAEQVKMDEFMCWPRNICLECKNKILDAYILYEQCMKSGDLLRECMSRKADSFIVEGVYDDEKKSYAIESLELVSKYDEEVAIEPITVIDQEKPTRKRAPRKLDFKQSRKNDSTPAKMLTRDEATLTPTEDNEQHSDYEEAISTETSNTTKLVTRNSSAREKSKTSKRIAEAGKEKPLRVGKKRMVRKVQLQEHEESTDETQEPQTKKNLYQCLLCKEETPYTSPKHLTEHLKEKHPHEIHCCNLCPKVFMKKEAFEHHQYCHATGRSYFCLFCDKGFQTEQLLKNHIKTHTHGTGFLCSHCGQEFSNRSNLRQHLIRHTGDKPWQCSLCPSRFSMKSYLDRHQHTHTKAKFFSCDTCGSQFSRHYSLVKHQLIHTGNVWVLGDRHFTCEVCNMRFTSSHHVKRHMLTHTGEKPFKCTYCERSFTQSNDMVKHMKTHVGNNPYQCDRCDASFRLLTDLRNHYKEHCQAGGSKDALSGEEDKTIRFTITIDQAKGQLYAMDNTDAEDQGLTIQLTFCRICADLSTEEHCIYETVYKEGTLSMHMMMERLIPSVFNAEQVKVDEFMCFPRKICGVCKGQVLAAYGLYEMSMKSGDMLRNCLKKNATFIVNITGGGSVETSDVVVSHPLVAEQCSVDKSNKSQKTIVETASESIASKDDPAVKQPNADAMDGCSIVVDDQLHASESEDHQSGSEEESALKGKLYKKKKPRKCLVTTRQTRSSRKNVPQKQQQEESKASSDKIEAPKEKIIKFRCLLCSEQAYFSSGELDAHLKEKHPHEIHCCNLCPKVFMTKAAFEHHQYCHATGRSHFCAFCDKGFQTEQLLKNHVKTHTHGTGFLCSQCGKEFSDRSNLRQHEYRHTGHKPWQCNLCPSRFSTKGYLTVHLLTHTKNKAYSCDTCGSQFNRHYSLVKHQVIHTGERHYECEVCKMRFASAYHVKIHMRTHTGEKPYKCGYCERGFAQKNDMLKHTKTHGKPYPCDRCDATFLAIAELRVHTKVHDRAMKYQSECSSVEQ
ncbi:uncharacterized protein LOC126567408 [Anopheles maculipalpis]|uniref:uncharacterized protein LOC126567408 n=1 Tax=Anopheles maculipalpis TaxID=1496333 RepID=UPI0021590A3D|nr:uncharacterized protein LOC126567408 [Anopheles maculipalpis]